MGLIVLHSQHPFWGSLIRIGDSNSDGAKGAKWYRGSNPGPCNWQNQFPFSDFLRWIMYQRILFLNKHFILLNFSLKSLLEILFIFLEKFLFFSHRTGISCLTPQYLEHVMPWYLSATGLQFNSTTVRTKMSSILGREWSAGGRQMTQGPRVPAWQESGSQFQRHKQFSATVAVCM